MNTPNQQPGTHHGLVPGFLPMSPQDGLDQFRVSGTMAVRSLLRELQGAREHVVLYAHADDELHLVTRIEGLEANDFRLGFPGDEESLEALLEARSLTLVGLTNAVKIQLDIPAVSLREDEGRRQLIAAIPSHGWRIQRREAFRVEPPDGRPRRGCGEGRSHRPTRQGVEGSRSAGRSPRSVVFRPEIGSFPRRDRFVPWFVPGLGEGGCAEDVHFRRREGSAPVSDAHDGT